MARAGQRGVSGTTIGLIVFAALFLTSMVFLIILYTDQEKLRQEVADLRNRKERAVSAAEETGVPLISGAAPGGPTMVGLINQARAATAKAATGVETDEPAAVQGKMSALLNRIQMEGYVTVPTAFSNVSLLSALETLYGLHQKEVELRRGAEKRAADLETQLNQAVTDNTRQKADYDGQVASLQAKLADCQNSRDSFVSEHRAQLASIEQQYNQLRADMNATVTDERRHRSALQEQNAELTHRYTELQSRLGSLQVSPETNSTARQADGRILKAVPGDEAVYINLGARDALVLGMEFAVYDSTQGIPADGRSKARIRVEAIYESSAECKIMQVYRNETIIEGDLIANPVYDRRRPLNFVVLGDFDLNRDGQIDDGGEAGIEAIVRDWGGEVGSELTAMTDFVVIGLPPRAPKSAAAGAAAQDVPDKDRAAQIRRERYDRLLEMARTLSVPVLTQDVFLNFLGYQGRRGGRLATAS